MPAARALQRVARSAGLGVAGLGLFLADPAAATEFLLAPQQQMIGVIGGSTTKSSDTFPTLARAADLGYAQLVVANRGIDPWLPGDGNHLVLPGKYILPDATHRGIVINLAALRLFYFHPGGRVVETFPIGAGVQAMMTPLGTTTVVKKQPNPTWYPPASIRAEKPWLPDFVPPGPDDPLGAYALYLGWPSYLIHGTNKPYAVGRDVSHGCIRLYPEDIDTLFHEVPVGTSVQVVDQEIELAWIGDDLYLQIFPSRQQVDQLDVGDRMTPAPPPDLATRIAAAAGSEADRIDWRLVRQLGLERNGIPTPITVPRVAQGGAQTPLAATGVEPRL